MRAILRGRSPSRDTSNVPVRFTRQGLTHHVWEEQAAHATQADGTQCAPGCVSEQRPTSGFGYGMAASMIHSRGHSASSGDIPTVIFVRLAMYTEGEVCANSNVQRARDNRHTRLFETTERSGTAGEGGDARI